MQLDSTYVYVIAKLSYIFFFLLIQYRMIVYILMNIVVIIEIIKAALFAKIHSNSQWVIQNIVMSLHWAFSYNFWKGCCSNV